MPTLAELKALKKKKKKKLKKVVRTGGPRGGAGGTVSALRPRYVEKSPPCITECPAGNEIRAWLTIVQHTELLGRTWEESYEMAWHKASETTPFAASCGRICPHPCEQKCNRGDKDDPVSINAFERFIGDYGIERDLGHRKLTDEICDRKVAVVGAGPAGLSCAFQLARRGYPVTVFEAYEHPGGMLRWGVPPFRLPPAILDAEIAKIADLGVDIVCNTRIGPDRSLDDLRAEFDAVYLGIGAHQGVRLRLDGEDSPNVWTGIDFLRRVYAGETLDLGDRVIVVGGGNTAIDAARVARRLGADVTIVYRRTREEMPAIAHEIDDALDEGVAIQYLAAPVSLGVDGGKVTAVTCQKMDLAEPDASGRRRPIPVAGSEFGLPVSALIPAISQRPVWGDAEGYVSGRDWLRPDEQWRLGDGVYAGGDAVNLDRVTTAIGHGRKAAAYIDDHLMGREPCRPDPLPTVTLDQMRLDHFDRLTRNHRSRVAVAERLDGGLGLEIDRGISEDQFRAEASRCMSCGTCAWCEKCYLYCQSGCVIKMGKGEPFTFELQTCDGCKKCAEECPCGTLDLS